MGQLVGQADREVQRILPAAVLGLVERFFDLAKALLHLLRLFHQLFRRFIALILLHKGVQLVVHLPNLLNRLVGPVYGLVHSRDKVVLLLHVGHGCLGPRVRHNPELLGLSLPVRRQVYLVTAGNRLGPAEVRPPEDHAGQAFGPLALGIPNMRVAAFFHL